MRKTIIIALVIIILVGGAITLWVTTSSVLFRSKPNVAIRNSVANVHINQVAAIRLDILPDMLIITSAGAVPKGLSLQPGFQYTKRKNPKAIALLLEGLQNATSPPEYYKDKMCSVQLILKNGETIGPFVFGNHRFADCFNPQFIDGLKLAGVRSLPHK